MNLRPLLTRRSVPKILQIAAQYPDVDIIEVVGHTDEQTIRRRYSNLDNTLIDVLKVGNVSSLVPADNAGLGMSRAVAVVTQLLQENRLEQRFSRILPMSGAQLIQVDETLSHGSLGDVKERRRIEIRLRKYEKAGTGYRYTRRPEVMLGRNETVRNDPRVYDEFEFANGQLRRALIDGIARRLGKSVEPVSTHEACSDTPLADLYHQKTHKTRITGFVDRLFRWWR